MVWNKGSLFRALGACAILAGARASEEGIDLSDAPKGTACDADQAFWASGGYNSFEADIEQCVLAHIEDSSLNSGNNGESRAKTSKCMQNVAEFALDKNGEKLYNGKQGFSEPCADCMADLGLCTYDNCAALCYVLGGSGSRTCRTCTINNCVRPFYSCSGLDTTCPPGQVCTSEDELPLTLVIGAVAGSLGFLALVAISVLMYRHKRALAKDRTSFAVKLALENAKAPSVASRPSRFDLEGGTAASSETPLVALFSFEAEHESELTVEEGERLIGQELADSEWWVARTASGTVGLIPRSYVDEQVSEEPDF